ncbi:hypothetical protein BZG17_29665, partial [Escherichia coli]|nr:hypothetical protein [Escherichia coli]
MDEHQKIIHQSTGQLGENFRLPFPREVMAILSHIDRSGRRVESARLAAWTIVRKTHGSASFRATRSMVASRHQM